MKETLSREELSEQMMSGGQPNDILEHQEKALAESEPFDNLRRDAVALGVKLSISLPLPERGGPRERYYADWLDEESRRQPALDTDIHLWMDLVPLIGRCLEAVANRPGNKIVILDEGLGEIARLSC